MNSSFLSTMIRIKPTIIKVILGALMIDVVIWAIMLLASGGDASALLSSTLTSTKFQLMFWVFAEALIVSILGFRCAEKGSKGSCVLALVGLCSCVIGVICQLLAIWEVFQFVEVKGFFSMSITVMGKITIAASITTAVAIIGALILLIKNSEKMISTLKSAVVVSGAGIWLIAMIYLFVDSQNLTELYKLLSLGSVFAAVCAVGCVTSIILACFARKDEVDEALVRVDGNHGKGSGFVKGEEDILSKVEVKETKNVTKMTENKKEVEDLPPLQAEDMAPDVSRDNELNIEPPHYLGNDPENKQ